MNLDSHVTWNFVGSSQHNALDILSIRDVSTTPKSISRVKARAIH